MTGRGIRSGISPGPGSEFQKATAVAGCLSIRAPGSLSRACSCITSGGGKISRLCTSRSPGRPHLQLHRLRQFHRVAAIGHSCSDAPQHCWCDSSLYDAEQFPCRIFRRCSHLTNGSKIVEGAQKHIDPVDDQRTGRDCPRRFRVGRRPSSLAWCSFRSGCGGA